MRDVDRCGFVPIADYKGENPLIRGELGSVNLGPPALWVVYQYTEDYPGKFVARKWLLDRPTDAVIVRDTLEQVRRSLPAGLTRIERAPTDDPVILETWL